MFGIVILAVYAVLMIGVTLMFTRKTTDAEGFHVADRRIGSADTLRVLRPNPFCKGDKQDQAQHIRYRKPEHPRDAARIGHLRGSEQ